MPYNENLWVQFSWITKNHNYLYSKSVCVVSGAVFYYIFFFKSSSININNFDTGKYTCSAYLFKSLFRLPLHFPWHITVVSKKILYPVKISNLILVRKFNIRIKYKSFMITWRAKNTETSFLGVHYAKWVESFFKVI